MKIEEKINLFLEKNCPTDPGKWAASKAAAKSKFSVYPSAYANGWAAKNYKGKGGGWRTCKEIVEYDVVSEEDIISFSKFIKEYVKGLNEDGCPCVFEAEYQGRKVKLGKPMAGDVKKFKVYVRNPEGNVVKVNFGQKGVKIKKSNPDRRSNFRARHNCDNPGPRHKARYWSCSKW